MMIQVRLPFTGFWPFSDAAAIFARNYKYNVGDDFHSGYACRNSRSIIPADGSSIHLSSH